MTDAVRPAVSTHPVGSASSADRPSPSSTHPVGSASSADRPSPSSTHPVGSARPADRPSPVSTTLTGFRPDQHEAVPLLSGYLIAESPRAVSVRVHEGTWTFDRADVLGIDAIGTDAPDTELPRVDPAAREGARPVRVRIRAGATADFTRRLRIDLTDRPMTLPQQHSPARGDDQLARQTERWARTLRLSGTGAAMTRSHTISYAGSLDAMACDSLD